jgi:hypothetical protein
VISPRHPIVKLGALLTIASSRATCGSRSASYRGRSQHTRPAGQRSLSSAELCCEPPCERTATSAKGDGAGHRLALRTLECLEETRRDTARCPGSSPHFHASDRSGACLTPCSISLVTNDPKLGRRLKSTRRACVRGTYVRDSPASRARSLPPCDRAPSGRGCRA